MAVTQRSNAQKSKDENKTSDKVDGAADDDKTEKPAKSKPLWKNKKVILGVGAILACVLAYIFKPMGKKEFMGHLRNGVLQMQVVREYGPLGYLVAIACFVVFLTFALPGTMIVDVAFGNVYGVIFGVLASLVSKLCASLISLFIGRRFGKALGLEVPEMLKAKLATVREHPFKCLLAARMCPIATGVKNYAFSLLPPEDVPIPQYAVAVVAANVFVTTSLAIMGANADSLVAALDAAAGGGH
eukprot:TRINITY_DN111395_c0_g1_i1.p1 TRINITY_DN111395_c0_g1~~TRINITY_DN111395_c0_g1_i1.p1  ORF type:complete len:243 (+),score=49.77 TRINITY_DN111395_c0_g1_i1:59-787(+)